MNIIEREVIRAKAFYYRDLFIVGAIEKNIAKNMINPFIIEYNKISKEKAVKFNVKPKLISFESFVRV